METVAPVVGESGFDEGGPSAWRVVEEVVLAGVVDRAAKDGFEARCFTADAVGVAVARVARVDADFGAGGNVADGGSEAG